MIICCDGENNWRKDYFPYYKMNRKKNQEDSDVDWDVVYGGLNTTKKEIKDGFPYKTIEVDGAEADDVIGTLAKLSTYNEEKTVIVSNDKDFFQLHSPFVSQWRPKAKSIFTHQDPNGFLKEQILRGDSSDGIPNIKSDDDTFVDPDKRQKKMMKADVPKMLCWTMDDFRAVGMDYNYSRNEELIDLGYTSEEIMNEVMIQEGTPVKMNKAKMVKFFLKNGLRYHHERINDFY